MLLTENLLSIVSLHFKYLRKFGTYPYNIDSSTNKLNFEKKRGLKQERLKHAVLLFVHLVMALQISVYHDKFSNVIIYEGILYACLLPFVSIISEVYFRNKGSVTELFNLIITLEQRLFQGKFKRS